MTSSERAQHVAEIVKSALERTAEDARVFLDQACAGDPETRAEVDSLLKFRAQANGFIERGALTLAAEALVQNGSLAGEEMIGDYKILSKIGAGGMGDVYLAEDIQLRRKVALKLVRAAMSTDDIVARFRHEEHILASRMIQTSPTSMAVELPRTVFRFSSWSTSKAFGSTSIAIAVTLALRQGWDSFAKSAQRCITPTSILSSIAT